MVINPNIVTASTIFNNFSDWLTNHSNLRWSQSRRAWTMSIKHFFHIWGTNLNYTTIYSNVQPGVKEHLTDIVWRVDNPRNWLYMSIESELSKNRHDILHDFRKLLDVKSRLHVYLIKIGSERIRDEVIEDLRFLINRQDLFFMDEQIVVIFFRYNHGSNQIHLSGYTLPTTGDYAEQIGEIVEIFQY